MFENDIKKLIHANMELENFNRLLMKLSDLNYAFLLWLKEYCEKNNLPIWKEPQFNSLLDWHEKIFREMDAYAELKLPDGFLQGKKPDRDFTEPCTITNIFKE
jgi:hypothetical protein